MIIAAAALLALTGTMLILVSTIGLRSNRRAETPEPAICEMFSPDNSLRCSEEIGHYGWHRNGTTSWYGDAWDCDHWADTQEAQELTQTDTQLAPLQTPKIKVIYPSVELPSAASENKSRYNWFDALQAENARRPPPPRPKVKRPKRKPQYGPPNISAERWFGRADAFWDLADKFENLNR